MIFQRIMAALGQTITTLVLFACLATATSSAQAQMIDEVEMRREGANAVLRLRFVAPIRLAGSMGNPGSEMTQVFYELLEAGAANSAMVPSERRIPGRNGLPTMVLTDKAVAAKLNERKLVVRVTPANRLRVRRGGDTHSIDLVLDGLGAKVQPDLPISAPAQANDAQRYQIVLQSSNDPSLQLSSPLPKELRSYTLGTAQRVAAGGALYELILGPFATQVEANRALDLLRKRFPQAKVSRLAAAQGSPGAEGAPPAAEGPAPDPEVAGPAFLASAREADRRGDTMAAIDALSKLLDLPPNRASREGQEMIGGLWLKVGDSVRARREYELFLKLYPTGPDAQRVTAQLAALPAAAPSAMAEEPSKNPTTTSLNGSLGLYYYGGQSKLRSEEFKDSGLGGLPELVQNPTISGTDQKLMLGSVDVNYRHRSVDQDVRFVFRDTFQANLLANKPDHNKLSALYVDYKAPKSGTSLRLGRQSPLGGGVLGRFDGVLAGYTFAPKWKINVVGGVPTDRLQQTKRSFYGTSIDADALTKNMGGSLHLIEQKIDGETDRRAVGTDLRYFNDGTFVSGSLDYDTILKAFNVASLQGTWQNLDADGNAGTSVNFMLDRRAQPLLMLGNALFFQDPNGGAIPVRMQDALALRDLETLRQYVRETTAYSNQAVLGVTTPLSEHWQIGGDVRLARIDAIPPVPEILPDGQAATGNIWTYGGQLIGTNLYSKRDTHVFNLSLQNAPTFKGVLLMYNNLSALNDAWQLEPSLQLYRQSGNDGLTLLRWRPGVRASWRFTPAAVLESSADYEVTKVTSPARNEKTNRVFYYLGGRYEF